MKSVNQIYEIKAPVKKVWQALVDPKIIEQWGGGPAVMSEEVGFNWSLWGGDIFGKNLEVEPNKKLVQEWSDSKKWKKPSLCVFNLHEKDGITKVTLTHSNIPDEAVADIEEGWKDYYLG